MIARSWDLTSRHRRAVIALIGLSFVVGVGETALLYLIGRVALVLTGASVAGGFEYELGPWHLARTDAWTYLVPAALLLLLVALLALPVSRLSSGLSASTISEARADVIHFYLGATWSARAQEREGHFQELLSEYCQRIERVVNAGTTVLVGLTAGAVLTAGVIIAAPLMSTLAIVIMAVVGAVLRPALRQVKSQSLLVAQGNKRLASRAAETTRLAAEVQTFDVTDAVARALMVEVDSAARQLKSVRFWMKLTPVVYQYGALGIVMLLAAVLAITAQSEAAAVGVLLILLLRILIYAKQVQTAVQQGLEVVPYCDLLAGELDRYSHEQRSRGGVATGPLRSLEFREVDFWYVAGEPVLQKVSLTIDAGECVGLVGSSGAGKSTFMNLALGLLAPTSGSVCVDSVSLDSLSSDARARSIAFVPQQNELLRGSVADNVRFYREGFSDRDVNEALRRSHLSEEVDRLPGGLSTEIGPGGRSLSGGQRQRLGLARALLGNPAILLLDEPTSALDPTSESLIRESLAELRGAVTLVIIAHRPATLEVCDRLLEVRNGEVHPISRAEAP